MTGYGRSCVTMKQSKSAKQTHSRLKDSRDLVRLITVLLFIPWFGAFTLGVFGFEAELETEIAVMVAFVVFGSFWCGWICPFGNLSYFVSRIGKALFPKVQIRVPENLDRPLRYLKYLILIIFIYVLFSHQINSFLDDHMDMYFSTEFTTFFIKFKKYAILLIPLVMSRFFCKYLCFQKGAYNIINRVLPLVTIQRDTSSCIGCGRCDRVCPMDIQISKLEKINGRDCVGCYNCVDEITCPSKADAMYLNVFGRKVRPIWFVAFAIPVYYLLTWMVLSLI